MEWKIYVNIHFVNILYFRWNPFRKKSGIMGVLYAQSKRNRVVSKHGKLNTFVRSEEKEEQHRWRNKKTYFETFLPVREKSNFYIRMFFDFLSFNNFFNICTFFLNLWEWKKDDCTLKGRVCAVYLIIHRNKCKQIAKSKRETDQLN